MEMEGGCGLGVGSPTNAEKAAKAARGKDKETIWCSPYGSQWYQKNPVKEIGGITTSAKIRNGRFASCHVAVRDSTRLSTTSSIGKGPQRTSPLIARKERPSQRACCE